MTFEDIIEQVIGEIADEYEAPEEPPIKRIDDDTIDVDARVHISEISEELDIELPDNGDYETVGGFVFSTLGRIPKSGEQFTHERLEIRIIDAEPRKINRLVIKYFPMRSFRLFYMKRRILMQREFLLVA